MSKDFIGFLKNKLGANFSMCSLTQSALNAYANEWVGKPAPVATEAVKEQPKQTRTILMSLPSGSRPVTLKQPSELDLILLRLATAAFTLQVDIHRACERAHDTIDLKCHFTQSRRLWNTHLEVLADRIKLGGLFDRDYKLYLALSRLQQFCFRNDINAYDDVWESAKNPVLVLTRLEIDNLIDTISEAKKDPESSSWYANMTEAEVKDYIEIKTRESLLHHKKHDRWRRDNANKK